MSLVLEGGCGGRLEGRNYPGLTVLPSQWVGRERGVSGKCGWELHRNLGTYNSNSFHFDLFTQIQQNIKSVLYCSLWFFKGFGFGREVKQLWL
jgi:hypothetical protein